MERKNGREQQAVSPVIGVILMVAVTLILAALISVLVFGFGIGEEVRSGVSVSSDPNGVATVDWVSEGNADYLNITVGGDAVMDADISLDKVEKLRMNSTGSSATILPEESASCSPCDRVHVRANSGDVAYWDSTGAVPSGWRIESCDINEVCESFDGLITEAPRSGLGTDEVPEEDRDIRIDVVAVKENDDGTTTKTMIYSEEIDS